MFEKRIMYTASYLTKNVWLRFVGKNMKQEYKTLEEIKNAIKEANIKDVEEYRIYKHEVETVEVL